MAECTRRRVLIVDDDPDILELIAAILALHGLETATARSGEQALMTLLSGPPDALVLDFGLPGLDGAKIARLFRSCPATARIPIVVVTAETRPRFRRLLCDAGVTAVVSKPFVVADLVRAVCEPLQGSPPPPPD